MIPAHVTRMSSEPPRAPRRRPRLDVGPVASRRSARRGRRSPPPSPSPPPRRSPRRRPSRPPPRAARPSPRRCPRAPPVTSAVFPSNLMRATLYGEPSWSSARSSAGGACTAPSCPTRSRGADRADRGVIRRAPSGGFSQGGSIVVVTDAEQASRDRGRVRRRALLARWSQLHRRRAGAPRHLGERRALPRALQRGRQARGDGRRRDHLARAVLVRRRRRADDARAGGGDRRGPRERVHRPSRPEADLRRAARAAGGRRADRARADRPARAGRADGSRLRELQRPRDDLVHWQRW